jgi:peptide/nickel transport system permease protein
LIPAGASITLLCSAFYLVGRALDEVVNPRLRKR